jgi:hypothetical protein
MIERQARFRGEFAAASLKRWLSDRVPSRGVTVGHRDALGRRCLVSAPRLGDTIVDGNDHRSSARHPAGPGCYTSQSFTATLERAMETNPVRQRIAELKGRLDALRGYL